MPVELSGGDQSLYWRAGIDDSPYIASIRRMESQLFGFSQNMQQQGDQLEAFFKKAATLAGSYFSLQAGRNFIEQMIQVRGEFQDINSAFETMLGSKEKADKLMAESVKLAATTPFGLTDVASGAKQLLAYGFAADGITQNLTTLGNVAAGVKAPLGDLIYLYGTLKASGRVTQMDINQFGGRGIPIYEELAKVLKINVDQVKDFVSSGKVGFPDIEKAFQNMTSQGGKFFDLMQKQSQNLTGRISNLGDAFDQMLNSLGQQNEGIFFDAIEGATSLVNNYQKVITLIEGLIVVYGSYRAAIIVNTLVTSGMTAAELLNYGALVLKDKVLALVTGKLAAATLATAAYTAGIAALSFLIYALTANTNAYNKAVENQNSINSQAQKDTQSQRDKLDSLNRVIVDTTRSEKQRLNAVKTLRDLMGGRLKQYSDEEVLAGKAKTAIDSYTQSILQNGKVVAAQKKLQELQAQLFDTDINAQSGGSRSDKANAAFDQIPIRERAKLGLNQLGNALISPFTGETLKKGQSGNEAIVEQYREGLQKQVNAIVNVYGKSIDDLNSGVEAKTETKTATGKNAAYFQKIIDDNTASLKALDKNAVDFSQRAAAYRRIIDKAKTELKAFSPDLDTRENKLQESALQKRNEIYGQFGQLHQEYLQNQKTQDQKEIDQAAYKYDQLLKKVDDYNAKHKVKIDPAHLNIDRSGNIVDKAAKGGAILNVTDERKAAIDDVSAKQQLEKDKLVYDAQKQLFQQYEEYKIQYGKDAADRLYKDQLNGFKTYVEYLEGLLKGIEGKTDAKSNALRDFVAKERPNAVSDQAAKEFDTMLKNLQRIDQATQTSATKKADVERRYNDDIKTLNDNRAKYTEAEFEERLKKLGENRNQELQDIRQMALEETELYRKAFSDITTLSLQELKKRLADAKKELGDADVSGDARKLLIAQFNRTESELNARGYHTDDYGQTIDDYSQVANKAKQIAAYSKQVQASFSELGSAIAPFDEGLGDTLSTIGEIAGVAGNAASSFASFASGDILGGITSAISAISGVFGIFGKAKDSARKAEAELKAYQDGLIKGEIALNQLLRERARSQKDINDLTTQELKARQAMLKLQASQAQSDYNRLLSQIQNGGQQITGEHTEKYGGFLGIARKTRVVQDLAGLSGADYDKLEALYTKGALTDSTKTWFEELQKAKQELDSIGESAEEAAVQLNRISTGTTVADITNAIADGFANGKRSVADFMNYFDEMMQKGLLSKFENDFLKGKVDEFYKQYAAAASADGGLTAAKIAELKTSYAEVIASASKEIENIEKVTGTSLTSKSASATAANTNSLQGSIKASLTEDTGTILAGTIRGVQLSTYKLVELQVYANSVQEKIYGVTNQSATQMLAEAQMKAARHSEVVAYWQRNLELATKIEENTRSTAEAVKPLNDQLSKVNKNIEALTKAAGAGKASLAANGITP